MGEVLLDALLDSLKVFPFLFLLYVLIEFLESRTGLAGRQMLRGRLAPLLGASAGMIPQCGFSVMAAKLYDKRLIRTGTLLAVFLATSDEAFILLATSGAKAAAIMPLILVKFAVAVGAGYAANGILRREKLAAPEDEDEMRGAPCGHDHEHDSPLRQYLVHPLLHSLEIFAYLLAVNILFGVIMYFAEDAVHEFLLTRVWWQPLIAAVVGLIPNCASSVLVTQAYIDGFITFGAFAAGLCVNAGLGFVVLFRNVHEWRRNFALLGTLFLVGAAAGYAVQGILSLF